MEPEYSGSSCKSGKRLPFSRTEIFSLFRFVVVAFMKSADFKSDVNGKLILFYADQLLVVECKINLASISRHGREIYHHESVL